MKIGILTFHRAHNYGAVLQAYALQEAIKSMGHDVEIINYTPKYIDFPYRLGLLSWIKTKNPIQLLKNIAIQPLIYRYRKKRYANFNSFIEERYALSGSPFGNPRISDSLQDYDVYVIGSDQIWNTNITGNMFDSIYWGDFKQEVLSKKLMTYAASMPVLELTKDKKSEISRRLKNFDKISVREESLNKQLSLLTNKDIVTVLDPTLLHTTSFWDKLTDMPQNIPNKYILSYKVMESNKLEEVQRAISEELGCQIITITQGVPGESILKKGVMPDVSPENFLALIKNAECIVTTSFHATVFSILFNKPFYVVSGHKKGGDSRSKALLKEIGMTDRFIELFDSIPKFNNANYTRSAVNKLDCLREKSMKFLETALICDE